MVNLFIKGRVLPVAAIGAALALSACSSNGVNNGFNGNGFNSGAYNVQNVQKVKLPKTRYGGQYVIENVCCQPVPVQRPVIEVQNIVEIPAPTPPPIIEYVYEQPVYEPAPEPVYVPEPAPVYTPPPAPSCPEGQIPAYGGNGCIPLVPLRK